MSKKQSLLLSFKFGKKVDSIEDNNNPNLENNDGQSNQNRSILPQHSPPQYPLLSGFQTGSYHGPNEFNVKQKN